MPGFAAGDYSVAGRVSLPTYSWAGCVVGAAPAARSPSGACVGSGTGSRVTTPPRMIST